MPYYPGQSSSGVSDGDKGDVTVSSSGSVWTVDDATITLAKMANLATDKLIGRTSSGTGVPEAVSFTDIGQSILAAADAAAIKTLLSLDLTATGGGTLATGGFTLTVPATGTAALLATANVFTAVQTVKDSGAALGISLTGAAAGGTPSIAATAPAQASGATVGTPLSITASAAVAGSSSAGAAAGGSITLTAGNAARLTSGDANGGNVVLNAGAAIGSGEAGYVHIGSGLAALAGTYGWLRFGSSNNCGFGSSGTNTIQLYTNTYTIGVNFGSSAGITATTGMKIGWGSGVTHNSTGVQDTALARNAAAVVEVNNGTAGQWGALKAGVRDSGTTTIVDGLTLGHQSTGTPAAGLGIGLQLNINSSTTADQNALRITAEWATATHASRKARGVFNVFDTASREAMRIEADGANPMIGFLGATAVLRQSVGAAATDAASTQTLANNLRTALINLGLATT